MQIKWILFLLSTTLLFGGPAAAAEQPPLQAFPAAKAGMQRFVIVLPHKDRKAEEDYKVEIITGKTMLTDGVNLVRLSNTVEARTLEGWGYTYYTVAGPSETISTLMAPPPGTKKVEQFVTAMPLLIAYNSRLPVVVYAPQEFEIRYRIWKAAKKLHKAEKR